VLQKPPRELLIGAFHAAVDAVSARALLPRHLPPAPAGKLIVIAVGKAAAAMAVEVEEHYPTTLEIEGIALTRHGHGCPTQRIPVVEAGHPVPDEAGLKASQTLWDLVDKAQPEDRILALLSGGGSSLMTWPAAGLGLQDIQSTIHALLQSGAPIGDINCVRKHLSRILGGRLAQRSQAPVTALLLSDVVGDDPSVIASGPFSPDPTSFGDALDVLGKWGVDVPEAVSKHLEIGSSGHHPDTPKPGDPCFTKVEIHIVGNGQTALEGAAAYLHSQGVTVFMQGDNFTGEARLLAQDFAMKIRDEVARKRQRSPMAWLSGGETQVTVSGNGRGGRNTEFLLALAIELQGLPAVYALAADTDGIDGSENNAGALLTPDTLMRAANVGVDAHAALSNNDAYGFFYALGDLILTGPTRTNANDFRGILIA